MNKTERPLLFTAACLLSFVGSGFAALSYFGAAFFFDETLYFIGKLSSIHQLEKLSPVYFALFGALYSVSLAGVIQLWKYRKSGFYLYTLAQLAILMLPIFWIGQNAFSATNAIFTFLFISVYFFYIRST